jgi:hypothetical protein
VVGSRRIMSPWCRPGPTGSGGVHSDLCGGWSRWLTGVVSRDMRVSISLALAVVGILLSSCASQPGGGRKTTEVTVADLLASPERFDGTRVLVTGYLLAPKVGDIALYQTEPDYHQNSLGEGIPLALDPQKQDVMPFQLKRCRVEGSFRAAYSPGVRSRIADVTRIEIAQ